MNVTAAVFIPGALRNPLHGSLARAHWRRKSEWAASWRVKTVAAVKIASYLDPEWERLRAHLAEPKRIGFLAQTGAEWDDDNLPAAIKPIRDALIGLIIHSDAPRSGHRFEYTQRIDMPRRGVLICVGLRDA